MSSVIFDEPSFPGFDGIANRITGEKLGATPSPAAPYASSCAPGGIETMASRKKKVVKKKVVKKPARKRAASKKKVAKKKVAKKKVAKKKAAKKSGAKRAGSKKTAKKSAPKKAARKKTSRKKPARRKPASKPTLVTGDLNPLRALARSFAAGRLR